LTRWQAYSDETVQVQAVDAQGVQHHTITPIARMRDGQYELDLVLRDNNVSTEHPDGIFHPHQDVQHIKKENIGLIEVMGLAILPARLKSELFDVQRYVLGEVDFVKEYHQAWAEELKANYHGEAVDEYVRNAVGQVFVRVLEDAGVFKRDTVGQQAFARFVASL
jgi:UDPglucose--hexose-1-phosphate uridylyltransferase